MEHSSKISVSLSDIRRTSLNPSTEFSSTTTCASKVRFLFLLRLSVRRPTALNVDRHMNECTTDDPKSKKRTSARRNRTTMLIHLLLVLPRWTQALVLLYAFTKPSNLWSNRSRICCVFCTANVEGPSMRHVPNRNN